MLVIVIRLWWYIYIYQAVVFNGHQYFRWCKTSPPASLQVQSLRFLGRWYEHQFFCGPSLHRGQRLLLVEHHWANLQQFLKSEILFHQSVKVGCPLLFTARSVTALRWRARGLQKVCFWDRSRELRSEVLSNHRFLPCDSTDPGHASSSSERL